MIPGTPQKGKTRHYKHLKVVIAIITITITIPGLRAGFQIGHVWITTSISREIMVAHHTLSIHDYYRTKYNWPNFVISSIHWEVIHLAWMQGTPTQFMHSSKLSYMVGYWS